MPVPLTPVRFLYRAIDLYPENTAVVCSGRRYTYSEFAHRCQQLAAGLQGLGIQAGDCVAYLSFNNHRLLEGYYGVPLAAAILTPLNVRLTAPELIQILNHCEPAVLFFEDDFSACIPAFRNSCPAIKYFVSLEGGSEHADRSYEDLLASSTPTRFDFTKIDESSIAELFYTSGSTGQPKGVMLSHRTLYLHALNVVPFYYDRDTGVELHTIPLFHANGWGRPHTTVMNGLKQVMVRRFDPVQVLGAIQEERATSMALVPTMAAALLHCPDFGRFDLSSMKYIVIGGAASSPELICRLEQAFKCDVHAGYGLTETGPAISCARARNNVQYSDDRDRLRRQSMAGWALNGTEMRVIDINGNDVPRDGTTIGEVVVRGDTVMDGYYKDPLGTAAIMDGAWLHTGDMAVWDQYRYVHVVDRKKDIIISGGENISSIEIENAIAAHPAVLECAVFAAPDEKWGEVPAAIVVLKPGQTLTQEELIGSLEQRIARYKLPHIVQFRADALPKTGTGKILKRDLREPFWTGKRKRVQGG